MSKLHIEISSMNSDVANGDVFYKDRRVGTIQFHIEKRTRFAVREFRRSGIKVLFPPYIKPLRKK